MSTPTSGGKAREFEYSVEDIRAHVGGKSAYWSDRALNHLCDAYTALEQDLAKLKAQNSHVCPECGHDMVSMDVSKLMDKLAELQKACEAERNSCSSIQAKLAAAEATAQLYRQFIESKGYVCPPHLKLREERDELLKFREKWEMFDGNSPGYNRDKARNYGRQAAELKSEVERLRAALGKILKCTHGLHDEDEIARKALEGK